MPISLNAVGLGRFHQRIHNGAGFGAIDTVAEQPILSSRHKGPDRVLSQIIGDRDFSIVQKCHKLLFPVQGIPYRILQLAALFRVDRFQPCKILLQKGQNLILAVLFPSLDIGIVAIRYQASAKAFQKALRAFAAPVRLVLKDANMLAAVFAAGIESHSGF